MRWLTNLRGTFLGLFSIGPRGTSVDLDAQSVTADRVLALPDADGTVIVYNSTTQNVDLPSGAKLLYGSDINIANSTNKNTITSAATPGSGRRTTVAANEAGSGGALAQLQLTGALASGTFALTISDGTTATSLTGSTGGTPSLVWGANTVWHAGNLLNIGNSASSARTALALGGLATQNMPGSDTQVLFNDGGAVGADSGLVYDKTNNQLTVGVASAGAQFSLVIRGLDGTNQILAGNVGNKGTISAYTAAFGAATLSLQHHGGALEVGGAASFGSSLSIANTTAGTTASPAEEVMLSKTYTATGYLAGMWSVNSFTNDLRHWLRWKTTDAAGTTAVRMTLDDSGLTLTGDIVVNEGTSFPASPRTNRRFFRTDRGIEYFYDGTQWLSVQEYELQFMQSLVFPITSTQTSLFAGIDNAHEIYLTSFSGNTFVNGTNNASNYWTVKAQWRDGTTTTDIPNTTFNTSADSGLTVTQHGTTVNAALNSAALIVQIVMTRTSSGGPFYLFPVMKYRLIG